MENSVVANNSFPQKSPIRKNEARSSRNTITGIRVFLGCAAVVGGKRIVSEEGRCFKGGAADYDCHLLIREKPFSCRGFWPVRKGQ